MSGELDEIDVTKSENKSEIEIEFCNFFRYSCEFSVMH